MDVELLERIQFITDATESECVEIARELREDYNIDNVEAFDDCLCLLLTSYEWQAEFAKFWFTDVMCQDIDNNLVVDWEATYNYALRYDFFEVNTYHFSQSLMRNGISPWWL